MLRQNGGYFIKNQNILLAKPMDGLKYGVLDIDKWLKG